MERVQQAAATEQRSAEELVHEAVEEHLRRSSRLALHMAASLVTETAKPRIL